MSMGPASLTGESRAEVGVGVGGAVGERTQGQGNKS